MGRQKLLAKKAELEKKQKTAEVFTQAVGTVNSLTEKIRVEQEKLGKAWSAQLDVLQKLDTGGDAKLEEIRKTLFETLGHEESTTPVLLTLKTYLSGLKNGIDKEMSEWIKKNLASIPTNLAVGMLFKSYVQETVFEVTKLYKGNGGGWVDMRGISGKKTGSQMSFKVSEIRSGNQYKYVKL